MKTVFSSGNPLQNIERTTLLKEYQVLDNPSEKVFDDIVRLAADLCEAPIALISFVDNDRPIFKASHGFPLNSAGIKTSFCQKTLEAPLEVVFIEDTFKDPGYADHPFVQGEPFIRSYAGAPLVAPGGQVLGSICVFDTQPRIFSPTVTDHLNLLSENVMHLLEMRRENTRQKALLKRSNSDLRDALNRLIEAQEISKIGSWNWNLRSNQFTWSKELYHLFGLDPLVERELDYAKWQSMIEPQDLDIVQNSLRVAIKEHKNSSIEYRVNKDNGEQLWILGKGKIHLDEDGLPYRMSGTALDITSAKKADHQRDVYIHTLEEMLFSLSHELRKPIATCLSLINVLNHEDSKEFIDEISVKKIAEDFKTYIHEIDRHVTELTQSVHEKREKLG